VGDVEPVEAVDPERDEVEQNHDSYRPWRTGACPARGSWLLLIQTPSSLRRTRHQTTRGGRGQPGRDANQTAAVSASAWPSAAARWKRSSVVGASPRSTPAARAASSARRTS